MHGMKLRATLAAPLMLACIACSGPLSSPHAVTDSGTVSGVHEGNVVVYKGIPFAAPPIGPLRWRPPQATQHWSGILPADGFKPQCVRPVPK